MSKELTPEANLKGGVPCKIFTNAAAYKEMMSLKCLSFQGGIDSFNSNHLPWT